MKVDKQKIRVLMAQRGIFLDSDLAEMAGVTKVAVSNWMTGKSRISTVSIFDVCMVLHVTPNDILDLSELEVTK